MATRALPPDLYAIALEIWQGARVLDHQGDPIVVVRHRDFIKLGATIDRLRRGEELPDVDAQLLAGRVPA